MSKMEPEDQKCDLTAAVEVLGKEDSKVEDRVTAYNKLKTELKDGNSDQIKLALIVKKSQVICECFVREITCKKEDPNTLALSAALQALGIALRNETFNKNINNDVCRDLVCGLCGLISSISDKNIAKTAIWCLSSWKNAPPTILLEAIDVIFAALESAMDSTKKQSLTVEYECMRLIQWLITNHKELVVKKLKECVTLIFPRLFHPAHRVRDIAASSFNACMPIIGQNRDVVIPHLVTIIKADLHKGINYLFSQGLECYALKVWCSLVVVMGKVLHHGSSLINCLLEVVERGFKSQFPEVRISAFGAWKELINNFAKDLDILSSNKRLRLILEPLKVNNAKTDAVVQAKLETWWHLIYCLESRIASLFDWVALPLFNYCFVNLSNDSDKNKVYGNLKTEIYDASNSMQGGGTPNGPKSELMQVTACNMLFRLLGQPTFQESNKSSTNNKNSLQTINFKCDIPVLNCDALSTPVLFMKHSQTLFQVIRQSHQVLGTSKNSSHHALLSKIWSNVICHMVNISQSQNGGSSHDNIISDFFQLVNNVMSDFPSFTAIHFKIIAEIAEFMPQRVLTSPNYHLNTNNVMLGTPSLFLINVLFEPVMVNYIFKDNTNSSQHKECFMKLVQVTVQSNPSTVLTFCQSVIQLLSNAVPPTTKAELSALYWIDFAHIFHQQIAQNQEVNQGDSLSHEFGCIYQVLLFPVKHLLEHLTNDSNSTRSIISAWTTLYKTFIRCAGLVATAETDIWCEELSSRLLTHFKTKSSGLQNANFVHEISELLICILENIHFSVLNASHDGNTANSSFSLKKTPKTLNKKANDNKWKSIANLKSTLEFLTQLINSITQFSKTTMPKNKKKVMMATNAATHADISSCLSNLFANTSNSTVLYELLTALSDSLVSLISELDPPKALSLWSTITRGFQVNYKGSYDDHLLETLTPLLKVTLEHQSKEIKANSSLFWHATFGPIASCLHLSDDIKSAIQRTIPSDSQINASEDSPSQPSSNSTPPKIPPQIAKDQTQVGSFLKKSPIKSAFKSSTPSKSPSNTTPDKNTVKKTPTARKSFSSSVKAVVDDMDTQDFVPIVTPPSSKKMVLTNHQKEMMKKHSFVPSMYNDLSQDTFQKNSLFSCPDSQDVQNTQSENSQFTSDLNFKTNGPLASQNASQASETTELNNNETPAESSHISLSEPSVLGNLIKAQDELKKRQDSVGVMICPLKVNGSVVSHIFRVPRECTQDPKLGRKPSIVLEHVCADNTKETDAKRTDDEENMDPLVIQETPSENIEANDEFVPSSQGSDVSVKSDLTRSPVKKFKQTQIVPSPGPKKSIISLNMSEVPSKRSVLKTGKSGALIKKAKRGPKTARKLALSPLKKIVSKVISEDTEGPIDDAKVQLPSKVNKKMKRERSNLAIDMNFKLAPRSRKVNSGNNDQALTKTAKGSTDGSQANDVTKESPKLNLSSYSGKKRGRKPKIPKLVVPDGLDVNQNEESAKLGFVTEAADASADASLKEEPDKPVVSPGKKPGRKPKAQAKPLKSAQRNKNRDSLDMDLNENKIAMEVDSQNADMVAASVEEVLVKAIISPAKKPGRKPKAQAKLLKSAERNNNRDSLDTDLNENKIAMEVNSQNADMVTASVEEVPVQAVVSPAKKPGRKPKVQAKLPHATEPAKPRENLEIDLNESKISMKPNDVATLVAKQLFVSPVKKPGRKPKTQTKLLKSAERNKNRESLDVDLNQNKIPMEHDSQSLDSSTVTTPVKEEPDKTVVSPTKKPGRKPKIQTKLLKSTERDKNQESLDVDLNQNKIPMEPENQSIDADIMAASVESQTTSSEPLVQDPKPKGRRWRKKKGNKVSQDFEDLSNATPKQPTSESPEKMDALESAESVQLFDEMNVKSSSPAEVPIAMETTVSPPVVQLSSDSQTTPDICTETSSVQSLDCIGALEVESVPAVDPSPAQLELSSTKRGRKVRKSLRLRMSEESGQVRRPRRSRTATAAKSGDVSDISVIQAIIKELVDYVSGQNSNPTEESNNDQTPAQPKALQLRQKVDYNDNMSLNKITTSVEEFKQLDDTKELPSAAEEPEKAMPNLGSPKISSAIVRASPLSRAQQILQASLHNSSPESGKQKNLKSSPVRASVKRYFPSPSASPSASILKKRKLASEPYHSTPPKSRRHVSFADPPVQTNVEIPSNEDNKKMAYETKNVNRCLDLVDSQNGGESLSSMEEFESCGSQQLNSEETLELEHDQPFYSELVSCEHNVSVILNALTSSAWVLALERLLNSKDVKTIGQFCSLTETEIKLLPIKAPKLYTAKTCLSKYHKKIQRRTVNNNDVQLAQTNVKDEEEEESINKMPSVEDALDSMEDNLNMSIEEVAGDETLDKSTSTEADHASLISNIATNSDSSYFSSLDHSQLCEMLDNLMKIQQIVLSTIRQKVS